MNTDAFDQFAIDFVDQMQTILIAKGHDYTGGENVDRLGNFKRSAADIGHSPLVPWYYFLKKHMDSIATYVKTGVAKSEPIRGRLLDLANYAILGAALIEELEHESTDTGAADSHQ